MYQSFLTNGSLRVESLVSQFPKLPDLRGSDPKMFGDRTRRRSSFSSKVSTIFQIQKSPVQDVFATKPWNYSFSARITVNASTTACEKAGQWQEALYLLSLGMMVFLVIR